MSCFSALRSTAHYGGHALVSAYFFAYLSHFTFFFPPLFSPATTLFLTQLDKQESRLWFIMCMGFFFFFGSSWMAHQTAVHMFLHAFQLDYYCACVRDKQKQTVVECLRFFFSPLCFYHHSAHTPQTRTHAHTHTQSQSCPLHNFSCLLN